MQTIPQSGAPKVLTTAIDGAEIHSAHAAVDGHAEELRQEAKEVAARAAKAAAGSARGFWGTLVQELGLPQLKLSAEPARDLVGDVLAPVKQAIGTPEVEDAPEPKPVEKLNAEEKKGLYVLLGIFVGGATLSKVVG